jgi:hypothetical protein
MHFVGFRELAQTKSSAPMAPRSGEARGISVVRVNIDVERKRDKVWLSG